MSALAGGPRWAELRVTIMDDHDWRPAENTERRIERHARPVDAIRAARAASKAHADAGRRWLATVHVYAGGRLQAWLTWTCFDAYFTTRGGVDGGHTTVEMPRIRPWVLNPTYHGDDATARRFANLEVWT